jgi:DNA-binding NarL/FixJ family response regulator
VETGANLAAGRARYSAAAWADAYEALRVASESETMGPDDFELLARSAYMLGRDDDYRAALERAHALWLDAGDVARAAGCTFWIGHNLLFRGQGARGSGWFAVGQRLLDDADLDCVERGYLLIPLWLRQMGQGDWEAGYATACEAAAIGDRFGDRDLIWLARDDQARALINLGRTDEALQLVAEALVIVESGALSPVVSGIVYCNTISFCRDRFELPQTRVWTEALARWCDRQPQMVAHNGLCLVHRAETLQYAGAWADALRDARTAARRFTEGALNQIARGQACYREGEIHRLQGDLDQAEAAFREANESGFEPQPGLALLRLAQGDTERAAATIRRAVAEHTGEVERGALLPAYVEIMLAVSDLDAAASATDQLVALASRQSSSLLAATAALCCASVALAAGDAADALAAARGAWRAWQELDAPYEAARARVLVAAACSLLGDEDSSVLELDTARAVFAHLGARPDVARVDAQAGGAPKPDARGLSLRELEVLQHVVDGASNRQIAAALMISEHTVARHLQNIFAKLGVASRTAASTFALAHNLAGVRGQE